MFQLDVRLRRNRRITVNARNAVSGEGRLAACAPQTNFKIMPGSVCAPRGFKAAAVFCDIKKLGTGKGSEKGRKDDLALIVSDIPAAVAGMFTTNQVCAAPVKVSARNAARKFARAIVVNSGNANACTGARGMADAEEMTELTAQSLGLEAREVLVCSTGRIGVPMPMANVKRGIADAAVRLVASPSNARRAAEAIMTSDTRRKEIAIEFELSGVRVRLGGICKGAGMIQPGMSRTGKGPAAGLHATMLAFLTTDAAIEPALLKDMLEKAVAQSFNRITVDGDMSTNDTVLILANGMARNAGLDREIFQHAINFVTLELAKMIVRDGEGVTRFITLHVKGARTGADAEAVARSVANSTLVKTSWFGGDPNWGRILCAMGYSNAKVNEAKVDVGYSSPGKTKITFAVRGGQPTRVGLQTLGAIVAQPEFDLHIFLNAGRHDCVLYTSDLTEEYVEFNKGNLSDPKSLGG
ncbi:MAG: glutamate N-acetyltransferase / amino-acid N-acetyltransferase [Verrucomicrobiota bacterium]